MESTTDDVSTGQKRSTTAAGLNTNPNRPVKRRASKACQCCRARKVRCNVVEHGAPCTNCRLDDVECVITESKRRKKTWNKADGTAKKEDKPKTSSSQNAAPSMTNNNATSPSAHSADSDRESNNASNTTSFPPRNIESIPEHNSPSFTSNPSPPAARTSSVGALPIRVPTTESLTTDVPKYIKATPLKLLSEDIEYLSKKGALSIPLEPLRSELIECYFLYVHPYMPLIDEKEFRRIISSDWDALLASGAKDERLSMLLIQSIYFAGSAFAPMESLRLAGYSSRKSARKAFFGRARLLYDFDWEHDRISLIQALLLLTYWYETPDDQKDTWHWMGLAISLAHTIGLHRNPENSNLEISKQHLWKKIWWSCFMRDRLVALGMRRPTRIKHEDCDVPMLTLADFDLEDCSAEEFKQRISHLGAEEQKKQMRNRQLAVLCIEKAKLSVIISHVLSAQYSVFNSCGTDGNIDTTRNTMILHPKKTNAEVCDVQLCDEQLSEWQKQLSPEAMWRPANGLHHEEFDHQVTLHRNLLHMVYFTTLSALHRPQVLPSAPAPWPARNRGVELQEISRKKVRQAAQEITRLAEEMIEFDLVKYLPTVGVTVMLPAVIIHLLDIKSSSPVTRKLSIQGFSMCMQVLQELRESYASADFATHFLEAAVKKADIQLPMFRHQYSSANTATKEVNRRRHQQRQQMQMLQQRKRLLEQQQQQQMLVEALVMSTASPNSPLLNTLTPPPEEPIDLQSMGMNDEHLRLKLESFLSASPPSSLESCDSPIDMNIDISKDFDTFIDSNATSPLEGDSTTAPTTASFPIKTSLQDTNFDNLFGMNTTSGMEFDPFLGAPTTIQGAGESGGLDLSFMSKGAMSNVEFDFDKIMENLEGDMV